MKYIKESSKKVLKERREYTIFGSVNVFVKDPLTSQDIDMTGVISNIEDTIPSKYFYNIDMIIIGRFEEVEGRGLRAAFMDGAIYVTNDQPSEEQIFEDIIHEVAHAVEKEYGQEIYADGKLESEYLAKKKTFLNNLSANGIRIPNRIRQGVEYSKMFDEFLHYQIGFEKSNNLSMGIFLSPYSSVSISEYFATAFEYYYVQSDYKYLMTLCPVVFQKIESINQGEEYANF